jgi:hypothetical protein
MGPGILLVSPRVSPGVPGAGAEMTSRSRRMVSLLSASPLESAL